MDDEKERQEHITYVKKLLTLSLILIAFIIVLMVALGLFIKFQLKISHRSPQILSKTQQPIESYETYNLKDLRTLYKINSDILRNRTNINDPVPTADRRYRSYIEHIYPEFDLFKIILFDLNDYEQIIIKSLAESVKDRIGIISFIISDNIQLQSPIPLLGASLPFPSRITTTSTLTPPGSPIQLPKGHYSYLVNLNESHRTLLNLLSKNYNKSNRQIEYSLLNAINKFFFGKAYFIFKTDTYNELIPKASNPYKYLIYFIYEYFHFYNTFRLLAFYLVIEEYKFQCAELKEEKLILFCEDVKANKKLEKLNFFIFEEFYKILEMFTKKTINESYLEYIEKINIHSKEFYAEIVRILMNCK